jgi:hypothetical protein
MNVVTANKYCLNITKKTVHIRPIRIQRLSVDIKHLLSMPYCKLLGHIFKTQ